MGRVSRSIVASLLLVALLGARLDLRPAAAAAPFRVLTTQPAPLAKGKFAWQATDIETDAAASNALPYHTGGVVALVDPIVVLNRTTGKFVRLKQGQAAAQADRDELIVSAQGSKTTRAMTIELAPDADVADPDAARMSLKGGAYEMKFVSAFVGSPDSVALNGLLGNARGHALLLVVSGAMIVDPVVRGTSEATPDPARPLAPGEWTTVSKSTTLEPKPGAASGSTAVVVFLEPAAGASTGAPPAKATAAATSAPSAAEPDNSLPTGPNDDADNDGLTTAEEALRETDPNNPDSDGDGLQDGFEVFTSGTIPTKADSDGDGLSDGDEVNVFNTNPSNPDTDGDGVNDGQEITNGTDPNAAEAPAADSDLDGDGLTAADEALRGTNPNVADSDGDGLSDGFEVFNSGTNPTNADSDGDGVSDGDEVNLILTNPSNVDTDGDGVADGQEITNGTDPNDAASK